MKFITTLCMAACLTLGCSSSEPGDVSGGGGAGGEGDVGGEGGMGGAGGAGGSDGERGEGGEGGEGGTGGENIHSGAGGMDVSFEDPDEGEPMDLAPPASLDAPFGGPNQLGDDCAATRVNYIRGWLVDRIGRPLPGAFGQICIVKSPSGELVCLQPENADQDGVFTISVSPRDSCAQSGVVRATRVGERRASMYCEADLTAIDAGNVTLRDPLFLYATLPPVEHPEYGDGMTRRTVRFADGLELDVVPYDLFGSDPMIDYEYLSARRVQPDERGLCFLEGVENQPDGLYAFAPEVAVDNDGAPVRIPNDLGLDAGAQVELSILGGLDCYVDRVHIEEGSWTVLGTATVNDDATLIESDPGVALPCLTWMGYRAL
jgi:hypothetical protein